MKYIRKIQITITCHGINSWRTRNITKVKLLSQYIRRKYTQFRKHEANVNGQHVNGSIVLIWPWTSPWRWESSSSDTRVLPAAPPSPSHSAPPRALDVASTTVLIVLRSSTAEHRRWTVPARNTSPDCERSSEDIHDSRKSLEHQGTETKLTPDFRKQACLTHAE